MSVSPNRKLLAIATDGPNGLDAPVSAHFGRCGFYALVELGPEREHKVTCNPNPYAEARSPGEVPRYLQSLGVNVIIAGGMGPRANALFESFGIEVASGMVGKAEDALARYLEGRHDGFVPCEGHQHGGGCHSD